MALDPIALGEAIKNGAKKASSDDAWKGMNDALKEYISTNAEVSYSWNGINPTGVVDSVTTAKGKILNFEPNLQPSKISDYQKSVDKMEQELIAALSQSFHNITDSNFTTQSMSMSTSPTIATLQIEIAGGTNEAFLALATCIVTWLKTQKPVGPILGTHGVFAAPPGSGGTVIKVE